MSRALTGTIYYPGTNAPWVGATIKIRLIQYFATDQRSFPNEIRTLTADNNGAISTTLATPLVGYALYAVTLPDQTFEAFTFYVATSGTPITFEALMNGAGGIGYDVVTIDQLLAALRFIDLADTPTAYTGQASKVVSVKSDESGLEFVTGGGGGGAPSGPAGGVLGGTYPNPAFAVDMATQAELDSESSTRSSADSTLQSNINTNTTAISTEVTNRTNADTTLQTNITSEASARASADAALQPLDSDLTAIAALSTTSYGRALLTLADAAAGRTTLGTAPNDAKYIMQTANSETSAEQALGALASGYMKVTTTTGVVSSQASPIPASDGGAITIGRGKSASATFYSIPGVSVFVAAATGAMTQNRDYYEPIWLVTGQTFDRITVEVTTNGSAGSLLRLGIFNATVDLQPGSLVLDAGTVAIDTNGLKEITISQVLPPGMYLLARNNNSTTGVTLRIARGGSPGLNEALGSNLLVQNIYVSRSFAAFPSTGTAWDTRDVTTSDFNHAIALRASAP